MDLNAYIRLERSPKRGYLAANKVKQGLTDAVQMEAWSQCAGRGFETRCRLDFEWYVKDRRRDPDNIAFARKFIMDGLVAANVLPNDTWQYVAGFRDSFAIDSQDPRVEIIITPEQT